MLTNIRNICFIVLYLGIWLSLDSSFYNLSSFKSGDFFEILISLRFIFPYIIFIILVVLFRKDLLLIKLEGQFKYIIFLLIISFCLQSIILFFNENNILNISFSLISIILLINFINFYNYFDLKNIFLISLLMLFFITTVYGSVLIHHLIFHSQNLNLYGSWPDNLKALEFLSNEVQIIWY